MKLLKIMMLALICGNAIASMNNDDKEISDIAKIVVDSSISHAIAQVGNNVAIARMRKNVDDIVWPAQQIQRAQLYENLKQDIPYHQKSIQTSLAKIKDEASLAKPFLLQKDHASDIIDKMTSRLDCAVAASNNDDIQKITKEFLHLLNNDGNQLHAIACAQHIKEQEQRAVLKNAYQSSIREAVVIAQKKNKASLEKQLAEKRAQQEQKNMMLAAQKSAVDQSLAQQTQEKKSSTVRIDPMHELDNVINDTEKFLNTELSYAVFKDALAFIEKTMKSVAFIGCKVQVSDINKRLCDLKIMHKNFKKNEKKGGKNKDEKSQKMIEESVFGISDLIVSINNMAKTQKNLLMPIVNTSSLSQSSSSSSSLLHDAAMNNDSESAQELIMLDERINVLKKQPMNITTAQEIRSFIQNTLTQLHFDDATNNRIHQLVDPAEVIYQSVCVIIQQGEPTVENRQKVLACLNAVAVNYSHTLKAIQMTVQNRLVDLASKK